MACASGLTFNCLSGRAQGAWRLCAIPTSLMWMSSASELTEHSWLTPLSGEPHARGVSSALWKSDLGTCMGSAFRIWGILHVGESFFLKGPDDLFVICLFTDTLLAESVSRPCRWLLEARLDWQKRSEAYKGVCKAGSAVGSVQEGKSSCRNFTSAAAVTLRPLLREHRGKE